jgi:hypothetical protein
MSELCENVEGQQKSTTKDFQDFFSYFGKITHKGKRRWRKKQLTNNVIEYILHSTQFTHGPSIWIDEEGELCKIVQHFVTHAKPWKEKSVVLLLGNHDWHISIDTINYCRQNDVTFLTFPPHCSHKPQPLDRSVSTSLTTCVNRAYDACITKNPGTTMTIYDTPSVVTLVYIWVIFLQIPKRVSRFLEFTHSAGIFFKAKNLRKLAGMIELPLLWRKQTPTATVNFLRFWWFSWTISDYFKSSNTSC